MPKAPALLQPVAELSHTRGRRATDTHTGR